MERIMTQIKNIKKVLMYSQDPKYNFNEIISYLAKKDIDSRSVINNIVNSGFDAVLTFGGDGTFLRGANIAEELDIPVIGFNHGHLGFLCSFPKEMEDIGLEKLINEELHYSTRSRLLITRDNTEAENSFTAFNDLVLKHGESGRLLDLAISINGEPVTRYTADGLIVSTPAGSTGYNLGAGGPIITSNSKCFIVTPICPHSLTNRPIVFGENDELSIKLLNDAETYLRYDGIHAEKVEYGESIFVTKASRTSKVVAPHANIFHTLQEKMNWSRL